MIEAKRVLSKETLKELKSVIGKKIEGYYTLEKENPEFIDFEANLLVDESPLMLKSTVEDTKFFDDSEDIIQFAVIAGEWTKSKKKRALFYDLNSSFIEKIEVVRDDIKVFGNCDVDYHLLMDRAIVFHCGKEKYLFWNEWFLAEEINFSKNKDLELVHPVSRLEKEWTYDELKNKTEVKRVTYFVK